jgi:hypothetical protein
VFAKIQKKFANSEDQPELSKFQRNAIGNQSLDSKTEKENIVAD